LAIIFVAFVNKNYGGVKKKYARVDWLIRNKNSILGIGCIRLVKRHSNVLIGGERMTFKPDWMHLCSRKP
jgi:hypothetical protein